MATALRRPVAHDDRLSITEHLDELRWRLIICVVTLVAAFGLTFWQNHAVLSIVNHPLEQTQHLDGSRKSNDPLEQNARFQVETARAFRAQAASATANARLYQSLAAGTRNPRVAAAYQAAARASQGEARAAAVAASAEPTNRSRQPVTLGVAEPFTATATIALYAALLLSLPMILYQLYAFILPAFSATERRVAVPLMMLVPALFIAGVAFGYFVVLPRALNFLQNFNDSSFDILIKASDYYKFAVIFIAGIGALFEIPVVVLGITRVGLVTPRQLQKNWGYVLLVLAIVAAVVTPTPDPVTMTLALVPLFALFELSILLSAWLNRVSPPGTWWGEAGNDDHVPAIAYDEED